MIVKYNYDSPALTIEQMHQLQKHLAPSLYQVQGILTKSGSYTFELSESFGVTSERKIQISLTVDVQLPKQEQSDGSQS
jgi:hypothetical protein